MAHYLAARVISVEPLKSYVRLTLEAPSIAAEMRPGQFVMVSASPEAFLARPFSIAHVDGDRISIVFQAVGCGTDWLVALRPGNTTKVLGPLGNGFCLGDGDHPVIVAGGRGIAPFYDLVRRISHLSPVLFYGGRTKEQSVEPEYFERFCDRLVITTEDGSAGRQGFLTDPLADYLQKNTPPVIYGCGPHAMLHRVAELADGIRTEFSMEARMACGFGICIGCVIPAGESGYRRVCIDGPIFGAKDIRWKDLT